MNWQRFGENRGEDGRFAGLGRKVGQQALQINFQPVLAACRGTAPPAATQQRGPFYLQVQQEARTGTGLSVARMCEVPDLAARATTGSTSRCGRPAAIGSPRGDPQDRAGIPEVRQPANRTRMCNRGNPVSREMVQRFMREDHLLCVTSGSAW